MLKAGYTISFCTTCMGRLHHLEKTLPLNLEVIENFPANIVLVNYNSPDGLDEWIKKNYFESIKRGKLIYVHTDKPKHFHVAHAKNIAHKHSTGEIVCNIDADNYFLKRFIKGINKIFLSHLDTITYGYDSFGRIAMPRSRFFELGGYDEDFMGWGFEDGDLIKRAKLLGLTAKGVANKTFIGHDDTERVKYYKAVPPLSDKDRVEIKKYLTLNTMKVYVPRPLLMGSVLYNANIQRKNIILDDYLVANKGKEWGVLP